MWENWPAMAKENERTRRPNLPRNTRQVMSREAPNTTSTDVAWENERLRVLHLYRALDTRREIAFDDLTRLAASLCHAPIAAVALVDRDRVRIKSAVGFSARSLRRGGCFVDNGPGRLGASPLAVEDTRAAGWRDRGGRSALSGVRSFAASPLISREGFPLGSLCVMDAAPRAFSASERDTLDTLARQVTAQLELNRNAQELSSIVRELRRAEKTIRFMAFHDALTGLPGRQLFQDRLAQAIRRARRRDEAVAVMFLDLDGFKAVNDTWGHAAGDRLLMGVASGLSACLRASDTVARVGGDEFAIICPDLRDEMDAAAVAVKLLTTVREISPPGQGSPEITASIGVALYPRDGLTPETLLLDADTAMYRAKRHGKNSFAFTAIQNVKSCRLDPRGAP